MEELEQHRERLAQEFDRTFALPFLPAHAEQRDFLVVRLREHRYALPVAELGGVQPQRAIRILPGAPAHCLGLTSLQGRLGAVYDLGALLGSPTAQAGGWYLQPRADPELALLVPKAERYLRVSAQLLVADAAPDGLTVGALPDAGGAINVLSVDRVVRGIRERLGTP